MDFPLLRESPLPTQQRKKIKGFPFGFRAASSGTHSHTYTEYTAQVCVPLVI